VSRAVAVLCAVVTALRLAWAAAADLAPDEAYYWTWTLDAPARDHPPGVAWLVRAGTVIAGNGALGVRLGAIACGAAVILLVWAIVREAIGRDDPDGEPWALLAAAVTALSPLGAAAAVIATPDAGLAAAWCAALYGLVRAERAGTEARARGGLWLAGAATAVGLLFKLTMGLFPLVALATLASSARGRVLLRGPHAWGAALLAAAPLLWMALAAPAPFAFQLARAAGRPGGLGAAAELLGAQVALATPVVALGAAAFLGARAQRAGALWWSAVVPLGFFMLVALATAPEAGWPGPAHVGAIAGAALWTRDRLASVPAGPRALRLRQAISIGAVLAIAVGVLAHVQALAPLVPLRAPLADPTERLSGWRGAGAAWAALRDGAPGVPAAAAGYGLAAELRFYDPQHRPVAVLDALPVAAAAPLLVVTPAEPGAVAPCAAAPRVLSGARPGRPPRSLVVTRCPPPP
jgi:4-amino-4-deoxy-L-arabinose transferase-like glycosyltransferase